MEVSGVTSEVTNVMLSMKIEEENMKQIVDQTIILVYCMIALMEMPVSAQLVAAFLLAVIYAGMNEFLEGKRVQLMTSIGWLAAVYVCPQMWLFTPLILYSMLVYRQYLFVIILGLGLIRTYLPDQIPLLVYLGVGCMVTALIQYRTKEYELQDAKLRKIRDDSTELNLLLKEKNKNLLEKQDYEIYTATLRERNRIAREIHDNVGHMLSRSILMVGALKALNTQKVTEGPLDQLEDTLNAAMNSVRESVHDLHDESVNLKEVLESLAEEYTFCEVQLEYDMGYDVPREIKYSFISIVKEAMNNIMKHSNATSARVQVREHPGLYQLVVEDNGSTMTQKRLKEILDTTGGIGIRNMKERIGMLGGVVQFQAKEGFRIFITVPKQGGHE